MAEVCYGSKFTLDFTCQLMDGIGKIFLFLLFPFLARYKCTLRNKIYRFWYIQK